MASYYIVENNQQAGPFTVDQLAERGISADTSVWTDGMTSWVPASQVYELQSIIRQQQPYQDNYNNGGYGGNGGGYGYQSNNVPMPESHNSKAVWSLVLTCISMFCCGNCFGVIGLVFSILGLASANKVSSDYMAGNYQRALNASAEANKWSNWAITLLIVGMLISIVCWVLYYFLVFAATMSNSY